ncbi:MAG: hypothetical protein II943_08680, partial [Victivallales bacterium]|nr:hypothetical protein [Victivallales bacterium]
PLRLFAEEGQKEPATAGTTDVRTSGLWTPRQVSGPLVRSLDLRSLDPQVRPGRQTTDVGRQGGTPGRDVGRQGIMARLSQGVK